MSGCFKSCLGRGLVLVFLVAVAYAGFRWGPTVFPRIEAVLAGERAEAPAETGPETSPDVAEATLDRFDRFRAGEGSERLVLGAGELSSVVRYALPGILPAGVDDPAVEMEQGRLVLSARVATEAVPDRVGLREVIGFLPDTVDIQMRGTLVPFDDVHAALQVDRISAAGIPLPSRFVPPILGAMGRKDRATLADDAMLIPLPQGLRTAYVLQDSLVLVAER